MQNLKTTSLHNLAERTSYEHPTIIHATFAPNSPDVYNHVASNFDKRVCRFLPDFRSRESLEQIHNHVCRIVHDFERSLHEIAAEMYAMLNYSRSLRNNMHAESRPTCQQNFQCNISTSIFAVCMFQDYHVRNVCLFAKKIAGIYTES